jgi:hypothetical protein
VKKLAEDGSSLLVDGVGEIFQTGQSAIGMKAESSDHLFPLRVDVGVSCYNETDAPPCEISVAISKPVSGAALVIAHSFPGSASDESVLDLEIANIDTVPKCCVHSLSPPECIHFSSRTVL